MSDNLYMVDPQTRRLGSVEPVSFAEIGIRERADLEAWVCHEPRVLGEDLLVLTSEFARFDRSDRRLDVLALDKDGVLVVVELKLELTGAPADQQAIRYAAFCSTMTMADAVGALAAFRKIGTEDAEKTIREFLELDELPELGDRPRVILAAGSLDDQELTSVVLWLRSFGIDITCVELTPYRLPGDGRMILVPRVIIPLPETKEYVVSVEKKSVAAEAASYARQGARNRRFWTGLLARAGDKSQTHARIAPPDDSWISATAGRAGFRFVYVIRKNDADVRLEVSRGAETESVRSFRLLEQHRVEIENSFGSPLEWVHVDGESLCKVVHRVAVGGWKDEARWSEVQDAMIDAMVRLERATRPHLNAIPP